MVHDLLPIKEADKTFYRTVINQGTASEEVKDMELGEKDRIWIENRHLHMKDLLEKLVADFNKFRADHPQFAERHELGHQYNPLGGELTFVVPIVRKGPQASTPSKT